jgi:hypothetical protein
MDISFSSDEEDANSERYFDTTKQEGNLEGVKQYQNLRAKSKQSNAQKPNKTRTKSIGKKSFDDVLSIVNRSVKSRASSRRSTSRPASNLITFNKPNTAKKELNLVEATDHYLNDYLRQKEEVLKDRAQRLINMSSL